MITVKGLNYVYPKAKYPAVNNVDFTVQEGEIFGFLGPSGAGKSTTQKVLIKLLSEYKGAISILNKDLDKWDSSFYEHIGVGFELPNHYLKLTALENLKFFAAFYKKPVTQIKYLLEYLDLERDANLKVEKFSKGMKMRLNFIRAVMHDPEILFFDEPTSGLDPVNGRKIKDLILAEKKKGKTIFLTTHNMADADELCDRVAFIVNGRIHSTDTPNNLKLIGAKRLLKVEYNGDGINTREFDLDNLAKDAQFIELIKTKNIRSMHTEENTLEQVFIKVTGKQLNN
ncbi:MAG: ABC transporter ATP-binding protein [Bacteroidales bacterium]|nr:ABC transporter ATP-binding protein [Bacteroidales bacterium]